jgi:hypothetical protein
MPRNDFSSISLREHVKVRNEANAFDRNYNEYFLKRYIFLRNFTAPSSVLELHVLKVTRTVLRRGEDCEIFFLSDNNRGHKPEKFVDYLLKTG